MRLVGLAIAIGLIGTGLVGVAACGDDGPSGPEVDMDAPQQINVTSTAFREGEPIPNRHSCHGAGVSPPLEFSAVPAEAAALALVVDDPDAPRGTFAHWVVLDFDPTTVAVAEGAVPPGGVEVANSTGRTSYFGPCPPSGTHRYRFSVYALRRDTGLGPTAGLRQALSAIQDNALAWGRLVGTYSAR
jgi:Raf kinase inhibitor-like YbhB/YbcL family protein